MLELAEGCIEICWTQEFDTKKTLRNFTDLNVRNDKNFLFCM